MGVMNSSRTVLLTARTTALTADRPGLLFAVVALRISAHSSGTRAGMGYLVEEDDYQF